MLHTIVKIVENWQRGGEQGIEKVFPDSFLSKLLGLIPDEYRIFCPINAAGEISQWTKEEQALEWGYMRGSTG